MARPPGRVKPNRGPSGDRSRMRDRRIALRVVPLTTSTRTVGRSGSAGIGRRSGDRRAGRVRAPGGATDACGSSPASGAGHKFDGPKGNGDPADQRPGPRVALQHPRRGGRRPGRRRPLRRHRGARARGAQPGRGAGDLRRAEPRERRPDPPEHRHPPLRGPRPRSVATDAYRWARSFAPVDDEPIVVFLDPPYREYEDQPEQGEPAARAARPEAAGRARSSRSSRAGRSTTEILPDLDAWDVRRYGGTQVAIRTSWRGGRAEPDADEPPTPAEEPPDADA